MVEKVSVNVAVTKLVDGAPDVLEETLIAALKKDKSINQAIINGAQNGFNVSCRAYYNYGKEFFVEGLPGYSSFTRAVLTKDKKDAVQAILETLEGEPVRIDSLEVRSRDLFFLAKAYLQDNHVGWDPVRQILTESGLTYRVINAEFIDGIGNLRIFLRRDVQNFSTTLGNISIDSSVTFKAANEIYYHASYHLVSGLYYSRKYWNYQYSLGTYPQLDKGSTDILGSTFMPIAPIRRNSVNVVDDTTYNDKQKDSVRGLLRKINIDLDSVTEDLIDPDDPTTLDDVDEVFVMLAMDVNSNAPIALAYFFESFRTFHYNEVSTQADWVSWWNNGTPGPESARPKNSIRISDSTVAMSIEWNFSTLQVKAGLVSGSPATPDPLTLVITPIDIGYSPSGDDTITKEVVVGSIFEPEDGIFYNTHSIIYRRQLTTVADGDPSDTFEELLVFGLVNTYDVYRGAAKGRGEFTRDITTMDDGGFIMPISIDVVETFNGFDEKQIYYESLQLVVYAAQVITLAWYQTSIFRLLITIAIVAISVALTLQTAGQSLAAGAALTTVVWAAIVSTADAFIFAYLLAKGMDFLAKQVGGEIALILAAVVAVIAASKGDIKVFNKLFTAEELLLASNALVTSSAKVTMDEIAALRIEQEDYTKDLEERQEELDKAADLLDNGLGLQLYDILPSPYLASIDETPEAFYTRTVHNGNPGVLSLNVIENYVDAALKLP